MPMNLQEQELTKQNVSRVSVRMNSPQIILCRTNWDSIAGKSFILRAITKEEEQIIIDSITNNVRIDLPWARRYKLSPHNIKIYGDFNMNKLSHRDTIKKLNLAGNNDNIVVPAGFMYKDGCADFYPKVGFKYSYCYRNLHHFGYAYTAIGRPERIVIFYISKEQHKNAIKAGNDV